MDGCADSGPEGVFVKPGLLRCKSQTAIVTVYSTSRVSLETHTRVTAATISTLDVPITETSPDPPTVALGVPSKRPYKVITLCSEVLTCSMHGGCCHLPRNPSGALAGRPCLRVAQARQPVRRSQALPVCWSPKGEGWCLLD